MVTAERTDTYNLNPGSLVVNKTITGAGAGQQGQITITVTCVSNGQTTTLQPLFVIPAGATDPGVADLHRHSRRLGMHGGRDPRRQYGALSQC